VNGRILGQAVIELGGGRKQADDTLDLSVGLDRFVHIGEKIEQGDPLLRIHASNDRDMERAKNLLSEAFQFSENPVESNSLILESIT
jgi:thymidine phosphorylase